MNSQQLISSKNSVNLLDYYRALESHDWTYIYSSDHKIYTDGQKELISLGKIADSDPTAMALYIAYSAHVYTDKPKPAAPLESGDVSKSPEQKFIVMLNACLESLYLDTSTTVVAIAKTIAMSERQLHRKVKRILNTTPANYLKDFRLQKAKELLEKGKSVCYATYESGFSSPSYFGKCFKELFGIPPGDYLKKIES